MYQDFPSKILCLTMRKIAVTESFTVALILGTEKVWRREGGGVSIKIFRRKSHVSHCRSSLEESFTLALISGIEKVWIGRGVYQVFPSKISCLTVPKLSLRETFTVALIF